MLPYFRGVVVLRASFWLCLSPRWQYHPQPLASGARDALIPSLPSTTHHWWAGRHRGSQRDISCGEKVPSWGWVHAKLFRASRGVCRSERQAAANCVGGFPHPRPTYPHVGGNQRTGARFPDLEKDSGWCELLRALETLLLSRLLA